MKEIKIEELKRIQLDILVDIHDFCVKHDIKYSLAYGTLIGAVRHNGYIPWDDDIDIMMTRENYDKFISLFPNKYTYLDLFCPELDYRFYAPYANVVDNRTILIEDKGAHRGIQMGVKIDIFPFDATKESVVFDFQRLFLHALWSSFRTRNFDSRKTLNFIYRLKNRLIDSIADCIGYENIQRLLIKFAKSHSMYDTGLVEGVAFSGLTYKTPISVFKEYRLMSFENYEFYIVSDYDTILSKIYGDYMKLPPEEKRVSHHNFKAWWKE